MITRLCVLVLGHAVVSADQEVETLHLAQTVPVPGVQRKWDHFGVDLPGNRLFVSSEEEPAVGCLTNIVASTFIR
jgi:hypothetical protein